MLFKCAILTSTILLLAGLSACSKQQGPSLSDTLTWMDQTYNPHDGGPNLGRGHGWETHFVGNQLIEEFNQTFTSSRCQMTIHDEAKPLGDFADVHSSNVETFDLRDIDPQSIKVSTFDSHNDGSGCADAQQVQLFHRNCEAEVLFKTHNQVPTIEVASITIYEKLQGADHEADDKAKRSSAAFIVDDAEYASRFAKAFRHAVELCGGTPSPF